MTDHLTTALLDLHRAWLRTTAITAVNAGLFSLAGIYGVRR